ncbi:hypothetical protein ACFVGY_05890 [Streptomyces sp. NPDC127106]|uniref:hypothetical protein n=1 Tax=Streptomyces sp. NPDC127106 TaxID=3345360 RepID=UPI003642D50C
MLYRYAALRRRCQALLRDIEVPRPFSVEALCAALARQRNRPLHLHPLPRSTAEAGACGIWLATDEDDHIFFEQRTSRMHQEHIVLHEIGHMLLDHQGGEGAAPAALLPDLNPRLVSRLLGRTCYGTPQEQEAEMLASLIRIRIDHPFEARRPSPRPGRAGKALGLDD